MSIKNELKAKKKFRLPLDYEFELVGSASAEVRKKKKGED